MTARYMYTSNYKQMGNYRVVLQILATSEAKKREALHESLCMAIDLVTLECRCYKHSRQLLIQS